MPLLTFVKCFLCARPHATCFTRAFPPLAASLAVLSPFHSGGNRLHNDTTPPSESGNARAWGTKKTLQPPRQADGIDGPTFHTLRGASTLTLGLALPCPGQWDQSKHDSSRELISHLGVPLPLGRLSQMGNAWAGLLTGCDVLARTQLVPAESWLDQSTCQLQLHLRLGPRIQKHKQAQPGSAQPSPDQ